MSGKPTREEFLARRKAFVGGSDIGAILGLSEYKTPFDVWADKTGKAPDEDAGPAAELGTVLEQYVAERYTRETGRAVMRRNEPFRDAEQPAIGANIDRQILGNPGGNGSGPGVLECKTAGLFAYRKMVAEGLPYTYLLQLQHGMLATGWKWGAFAVLCRDNGEFVSFTVEADPEIHALIRRAVAAFWRYVESGTPPPEAFPAGEEGFGFHGALPASAGRRVAIPKVDDGEAIIPAAGEAWALALRDYSQAVEVEKEVADCKEQAKARLCELMGEATVAEGLGFRVYYRAGKPRASVDSKRLKTLYPDAYAECLRESPASRSLRVYPVKPNTGD